MNGPRSRLIPNRGFPLLRLAAAGIFVLIAALIVVSGLLTVWMLVMVFQVGPEGLGLLLGSFARAFTHALSLPSPAPLP